MTTVILAEKPSQAKAYATSFSKSARKNGYYEIEDSLFPGETYVTYGFGHLVELVAPGDYSEKWEKWDLESLPIFPDTFKFTVPDSKMEQFEIVKNLLLKADTIVIATDPDREGENIAWSIIHHAGAYSDEKSYKRLWINSLETKAIREGFENLKEGLDYVSFYKEAQTRQISDWLFGMNGSPLYSLLMQQAGIPGTFSLGRVQTPTLYMVFDRQQKIDQFKKDKYYEIQVDLTYEDSSFKGVLSPIEKFNSENDAIYYLSKNRVKLGKSGAIVDTLEVEEKETSSPSLFSLSSLQSEMNKSDKISVNDTLKAVQGLYEKRLLTYPRTSTTFITNNEYSYLKAHLREYLEWLDIECPEPQLEPLKKHVNDDKVLEHHAIILTKQVPNKDVFESLTANEKKVYLTVAKNTVAMFFPTYKFEETKVITRIYDLYFHSKGIKVLDKGWKVLFDTPEKNTILPTLWEALVVDGVVSLVEKQTTPPKPFTEGTLITAMKTADKTVQNDESKALLKDVKGIGTEATRSSIIETLKTKEYIEIKKNNISITNKGILLCKAIEKQELLTSAEMTANWESYLSKIGENKGSQDYFINMTKEFINKLIAEAPEDVGTIKGDIEESKLDSLLCPKCAHILSKKKGFYGCSNYPTCKFSISETFRERKLSQKNIKELLAGKETKLKKIPKKNSKSTYNAILKLNSNYYIDFVSFFK